VRYVFILLAGVLLGCGGSREYSHPIVGQTEADDQTCRRDQDCALVEDCCGCASGGTKMAVRADRIEALSSLADSQCAGRACSEAPSAHRSCSAASAICRGGRCIPAL
jgi:hypothetical protein